MYNIDAHTPYQWQLLWGTNQHHLVNQFKYINILQINSSIFEYTAQRNVHTFP